MTAHALLSASGAKRWLSCPPSARLEADFPNETSTFAAEGTAAHELAELFLRCELGGYDGADIQTIGDFICDNKFYDQAMEDYVIGYCDFVLERFAEAKARTKDAEMFLEQRLDFSTWVPEGFGTGDVVIIADGALEVIDLKYGKGVPVEAEGNPQLKLYGLGAWAAHEMLYDIKRVRMTIVQPRLDSITSCEMLVGDLLDWAEKEVKPRAALAIAGKGEFCAGDHCRFCRVRFTCRARAEANLELAKMDFRAPAVLSDSEIATVLEKAAQLQAWASDVQAYALDQAENHGKKWDGWKLVEGRSVRKYADEAAVAEALKAAGYEEETLYTKSLLGITAMEKTVGKKPFGELLKDLVIKPAGKPVLVPETDKRPEISSAASAAADFAE